MALIPSFIIILIACIFPSSNQQKCSAKTDIPNLIQDSFQLMVQQQIHQLIYSYPTFIFNSFPQVALSISKFEWKQFGNIDFNIEAKINQKKGGLEVQFNHTTMKWRAVRINFWLFERNDLFAGIAVFENFDEYAQKSQIIEIEHELTKDSQNQPILYSTILSLKAHTTLQTFQITSKATYYTHNTIKISVETGSSTVAQYIKISYLLYQPTLFSMVAHHYGTFNAKFNSRKILNQPLFGISIYPVKYSLMGLSALRILGSHKQSLSLTLHLSQNPTDLIRVISSSNHLDFLQIQYLFLGQSMMISCIECGNSYIEESENEVKCIEAEECKSFRTQNFREMYFSCRKCPQSQGMKIDVNQNGQTFCECQSGYTVNSISGRCVRQDPTNALRQCPGMFQTRLSNGTCVCQKSYVRDEFGLCGGVCSTINSYWDAEELACKCFHGYAIKPPTFTCSPIHNKCSENQISINGKCECDANTVWNQERTACLYCPSGKFKSLEGNCSPCDRKCSECVSTNVCSECLIGYTLNKFTCIQTCGDGINMEEQIPDYCDDGNNKSGDGCSGNCKVEEGFECQGGSRLSQDICYPQESLIEASSKTEEPTMSTDATNFLTQVTYKLAQNETAFKPQQIEYNLKLKPKSPMYLTSGIMIDLILEPQIKRTQTQIQNMMEVTINQTTSVPESIYISVDEENPKKVRCYLHYNHQLPILDFLLTIQAHFTQSITKSLNIYTNTLTSDVTSALNMWSQQQNELL